MSESTRFVARHQGEAKVLWLTSRSSMARS